MSEDITLPRSAAQVTWEWQIQRGDEGEVLWQLYPDRPRWAGEVIGRSPSREHAEATVRKVMQRCHAVGNAALSASDGTVCRIMTLFPEEPAGGSAAVTRLSVSTGVDDTTDSMWDELERRALDWQTRGGRQTFVASDTSTDESGERLRELFGCLGALGEQATLACAAARDLAAANADADSPNAELLRRAWAEHTIHWIMAAGHMLLNVIGRTIALDRNVHPYLLANEDADSDSGRRKAIRTVFPCESDAHNDWPTLSLRHANYLRRAASKPSVPAVARAGQLIHEFVADRRWTVMNDLRGEAFHRWRAQTVGVSTMTRRSPRVVNDDGLLPDGMPHDVRGPETAAKATQAAEDALMWLGDVLAQFDDLLSEVMEQLTVSRLLDDGLLVVLGVLPIIEISPGTAAALLIHRAEQDAQFQSVPVVRDLSS